MRNPVKRSAALCYVCSLLIASMRIEENHGRPAMGSRARFYNITLKFLESLSEAVTEKHLNIIRIHEFFSLRSSLPPYISTLQEICLEIMMRC